MIHLFCCDLRKRIIKNGGSPGIILPFNNYKCSTCSSNVCADYVFCSNSISHSENYLFFFISKTNIKFPWPVIIHDFAIFSKYLFFVNKLVLRKYLVNLLHELPAYVLFFWQWKWSGGYFQSTSFTQLNTVSTLLYVTLNIKSIYLTPYLCIHFIYYKT